MKIDAEPGRAVKMTGESVSKIFGFAEANKMYIKSPLKFVELQKDEKGFYVFASKA